MTAGRARLLLLAIPAVAGLALIVLPLAGLLGQAAWSGLWSDLRSEQASQALRLSMICSFGALAVSAVVGLPLAWMLARSTLPGTTVVRALVTLPMVLPPVVGGVALLDAFGRRAPAGRALDAVLGVRLPFTTAGAVVAEAFVAMPFLVVAAEAAFRSRDRRLEDAAATLGAGPLVRFARVTLPAVGPALAAAAALCWARALGEFGATVTFAGNLPGRTQTMPTAVYVTLQTRPDAAVALSLVLLVVCLVVLIALRGRWVGALRNAR